MKELSCAETIKLMNTIYDGKITEENDKLIQHHCDTCENCRNRYNEIKSIENREITDKLIEQEIKKSITKKRLKITIILGSIFVIVALISSTYLLIMSGKFTFLADRNYGISETYSERTDEHPSYKDVQEAMDVCIENYPNLGKGTALLSLTYDEQFTFNKESDLENIIAIDYTRMIFFNSESYFEYDDTLVFLIKYDDKESKWIPYNRTKKQQLIESAKANIK